MFEKMQELLKEVKKPLKLDLQFFADETPPPVDETPPTDTTPPVDEVPPVIKTFTQDDVTAIAAKEAKKAQEKLLKQLGVTDFNTAKEGLDKLKEITDAQKTDAQKAIERAQELELQAQTHETKAKALEAQLAAMKAGVNTDSVEDVVLLANRLVNEDTDLDTAIGQVLTKYPQFKAVIETKEEEKKDIKKPSFTQGEHNPAEKQTENDVWSNAFSWGLPQTKQ